MRKLKNVLLTFMSFGVIFASLSTVVSCWIDTPFFKFAAPAYDEDGNNVTDMGSDNYQLFDYDKVYWLITYVTASIEPDLFKETLNNKNSNDELAKYFIVKGDSFHYDFTFLMTNYSSIDSNVIQQMKENELQDKEKGLYLFLNLPENDVKNIKNEEHLVFQFIFIIKDENGAIKGNDNNDWFYWKEWKLLNILDGPGGTNDYFRDKYGKDAFFFNVSKNDEDNSFETYVVTKYWDNKVNPNF